jgi:SNF2 family DNA or RNA helicase
LTGTPIENRLSELWSIFDYLMPGFLFSYDSFRNQIEIPIVKNENADILERLHRMIGSFILRRNKRDVLKDLPDKLEEIRYAGMTGKQQELYDAQVIRMRNNLKDQDENDFRKSKIEVLAELMRIRQICCDPSLCYTNYDGESAKTDLCMELLRNLMDGGHRTLLFSQFTSMLEILQKRLDVENIPYYTITGSTSKEERLRLVKAFNENEIPVFLISLKAGGTGLNLVGADSVIHYDPWWNTAAEDQASDRAHRIGQKNVVTVYKLVVKGTIEEKIVALQQQKAKLASDILGGESIGSASLSREDLLEILV